MENAQKDLKDMVQTNLLSVPKNGGQRYTSVVFDPEVSSVQYTVYCVSEGEPVRSVYMSGELDDKFSGEQHAFVIPVKKGVSYFIKVVMSIDAGWEEQNATLSWMLNPFKRRQPSREDLAPAPSS